MAMANYQTTAYKQTRVKTAGPGQLVVMLYDEAIRQLEIAADLLNSSTKQLDKVNNSILKARDIITELMVSLDMEQGGEFAQTMFSLYLWFNEQLLEANLRKRAEPIQIIAQQLSQIRDAWSEIAGKTTVAPQERAGVNIAG
ncbi:MAG: flagellar export chaperone FliS [Spirochaetales bacterium]|nr:flagellar export chaperone FliS [Spirochaetales bacterium]